MRIKKFLSAKCPVWSGICLSCGRRRRLYCCVAIDGGGSSPRRTWLAAEGYKNATSAQYCYLLVDLKPNQDERCRLITNIFPGEMQYVYVRTWYTANIWRRQLWVGECDWSLREMFGLKKPKLFVCQTEPSNMAGEHRFAIYVDDDEHYGEHFDSLDRRPVAVSERYMNEHCRKWTCNCKQL